MRRVVVGILFGLSVGLMLGDVCASRAQAQGAERVVLLKDPWGSMGGESALMQVQLPSMTCAVLIVGPQRQSSLWCK